ncbi:MAG: aminopeptidase P family protein [Chloroflexi bacterium]|nr:MAG: aminopeptidase P family protein [Chloroflexota bacterium]
MPMNVARAQSIMQREGLGGLVASTLENFFYLSGIWNLGQELFPYEAQAYVVATRDKPDAGLLAVSVGEADLTLEAYPTIGGAVTYGTFYRELPEGTELSPDEKRVWEITYNRQPKADAFEALCAAIEDSGLSTGTLGVDERGPNRDLLDQLRTRSSKLEVRPASQTFRLIRMVKTPAEHERLKGALRATEHALRTTIAAAREGSTERELKHTFEQAIVEKNARPGFTLLRFGRGMALGQVAPGDTKLQKGDYIWFDVGCTYQGYRSDIGRIVSFGEPSEKLRRYYDASKGGQSRAFELMTPGRVARDVFNGAVERVRELGIPHYRRHHVGHGIGVEYYDLPILNPRTEIPLEVGMVFEVETPYYEFGFGGAFIEDTVLDNGVNVLTELPRDLQVIGV